MLHLVVVSPRKEKKKKKKRNINNDLAVLPSHDRGWVIRAEETYKGVLKTNAIALVTSEISLSTSGLSGIVITKGMTEDDSRNGM